MRIAIGSDHCGYEMKLQLKPFIVELGHEIEDYGCHSSDPVDFPEVAAKVCSVVRDGSCERAIIVCGTGVGAAIAANKIPGIRAAVCHDVYSAHQSVEHDDVNVMCIGAQIVGPWLVKDLVSVYLKAEFSTAEHFRRRVGMLHELELKAAKELSEG